MQGTVASFKPETGDGTVYLDDGTELAFPAAAFAASGLRLLRPGQRVKLRMADGAITALTHISLPFAGDGIS
jgi:2-phospho-L-lactate guanylyltransferase